MGILSLIFFMIWPFGALLFSFKNYSTKWTKNIIWLFVIFYGYTFVLFNDTMDANRLQLKFDFFQYTNFDLARVIEYFFLHNEEGVDIIQPVILYLTSIFSHDFQVLMAVLAFIFGFFYSRNICYLLDRSEGKISIYNYWILWSFIFVIGFWNINGFRFWTAAHIFFYAIMPFIYERNKKRLWLLPFVALLHFSYLFPILAFIVFLFVKQNIKIIFYIFIFSFFVGTINTEAIGDILLNVLPGNFERKVIGYTSAEYANEVLSEEASMSAILRKVMFAVINIYFIVFYYYNLNKIKMDPMLYRLFVFCILIMTFGNFASLIPSGQRFLVLSALFSLSFIYFYIQKVAIGLKFKILLQVGIPFLFLASIGYIRIGLNTINELVLIGNPITMFFIDSGKALIEWFL